MSIIGQEIENYTIDQINARQKLHGSGTSTNRTPQQISVLNSNTSWIKLASGVSVDESKLTELGLSTSFKGMELAKNNVLFGGTAKLVAGERLQQKDGFLPHQSNSSYSYGDFGYSPMPGIMSADIKALNRGSLKKATVKFKVHNKQQFDIVDVLYMRLGYTVLLEWGNSMYTSNGTDRQLVQQTIIEDSVRFFSSGYEKGKSYRDMLPVIEYYRNKYDGNYDGLLGKVSNFNWSFQPDGSYDIEITVISLGDVVESLKTNISSNKQLSLFIESALSVTPSGSEGNNVIEENADSNDIAAMLYCWKFTNQDSLTYDTYENSVYIKRPDVGDRFVGGFLKTTRTVSVSTVTYKFTYVMHDNGVLRYVANEEGGPSSDPYYNTKFISYDVNDDHQAKAEEENDKRTEDLWNNPSKLTIPNPNGTGTRSISSYYEQLEDKIITADSPIKNFGKKDACFIITEPDKQFYLRFGALLGYIKNKILPKVNTTKPTEYKNKPPIFSINVDPYGTGKIGNYMYSLPNQISLDPRVCMVKNEKFQTTSGITEVYKHLKPFRAEDYVTTNPNPNKAYIMNIYLNFEFIISCINDNLDERGDIGIFGFLKAICDGLNKSLGGINNLEPIINEDTNTLYIIDTTPIPGIGSQKIPYTLQLFGYNAATSNFVRNVDLKTAITPEYATMITVGATAGGYVKGTESTAFSKWNVGLTDRFQEEFIPGNENSAKEGNEDEAASNYTNKFISSKAGTASRYGFKGNLLSDNAKNLQIDPGAIEKNISVVTEYYKYLIASQKNQQGGTIGFIPFKLNFSMDGISGIKIYNKLHVDTRFLPKAYGNELDLIVTGVNHKLANNDWETDIETTLIPKTNELKDLVITAEVIINDINNNPPGGGGGGTLSSCSSIPQGNGLTAADRAALRALNTDYLNYKGIQNTDEDVIDFIRGKNEGGYFHPIQYIVYESPTNVHPKSGGLGMGNSGETLWGEDRYAGDGDSTPKKREFWSIVDKYSGFGSFYALSLKHGKKWEGWNKWKSPGGRVYKNYQSKAWKYNDLKNPDTPPHWGGRTINQTQWRNDLERLKELKYEIVSDSFYSQLNSQFATHPELKNLILSDVRTRYMWYRARYNGPLYFQKYATNLKMVWDSGERNIDKLICADFTYRYNYNKGETYEPDIKRMADYVIPNR